MSKWRVGSANLPCSTRGYGSDSKPLSVAHNVTKSSDSHRFAPSIIHGLKERRENEGANGCKGKQQRPTSSFEAAPSLFGKPHCAQLEIGRRNRRVTSCKDIPDLFPRPSGVPWALLLVYCRTSNGSFAAITSASPAPGIGPVGARRVPGCPGARCLTLLELWRFPGTDGLVRQSGIGAVRYIGLCPRDSARFARH
jgi:hypothetical protein